MILQLPRRTGVELLFVDPMPEAAKSIGLEGFALGIAGTASVSTNVNDTLR